MKRFHICILVLATFVAGGIVGSWFEHRRVTEKYKYMGLSYQLQEVSQSFDDLCDLRKGDTNALVYRLERQLDTGLVFLSQQIKPQTKDDPNYYGGLFPAIRAYRMKNPSHSTDTNWDNRVAAALSKIP
jgi:hypothetical protein